MSSINPTPSLTKPRSRLTAYVRNWELYLFLLPATAYIAIFAYGPMYGVLMAFQDYKTAKGIWGSAWVGLKHFQRFLTMPRFGTILTNTLSLSVYTLVAGFPLAVVFALLLNQCGSARYRRTLQTVTYLPHFISTVVVVSMLNVFFAPTMGVVSNLLRRMGLLQGELNWLVSASAFSHLYVWSGVWKGLGWSTIIYLSALSAVDPSLHEAAVVDGATKPQRVLHIDLPALLPTATIILIMDAGKIMNVGFEKVFLMQNAMNTTASEIISTYVYKVGLQEGKYSLSTAISMFNSIVNCILLVSVNALARKVGESSLW